MTLRVDDLEKNQLDYIDSNNLRHNTAKVDLKTEINGLKEEMMSSQK